MKFSLQQTSNSQIRIVDARGTVCGILEPTVDGIRIRGQRMAVTLAYGAGEEDGCKILLMEPEPEL